MPNFGQFGNATPDTEKEKATVVTGFTFSDDDFKDKGGLFDLIPKGRYHFVVYDCQTGFTKKDNTPMKVILMDIHHEDGTKTRLTDYLVYTRDGNLPTSSMPSVFMMRPKRKASVM